MPKLIEGAREAILVAAERLLLYEGYENLTIRGIASECGMAIGTVYNYFHAKDEIVFFLMREEWDRTIYAMAEASSEVLAMVADKEFSPAKSKDAKAEALGKILSILHSFTSKYKGIWRLMASATRETKSASVQSYDRTEFLSQLQEKIKTILAAGISENSPDSDGQYLDFLASFITAAFTRFAMDDTLDHAKFEAVLRKLI
jgi:AcrR family transcriptional regulator